MLPRQRRKDNRSRQQSERSNGFRFRAQLLCGFMVLGFAVIGLRLISVGLIPTGEPDISLDIVAALPAERGNIVDANGELMATTLTVNSLFADPKMVLDIEDVARRLPTVLHDVSAREIRGKLAKKNRFVWLKRGLTPHQVYAVNSLGIPGLGFREEKRRLYPQGSLATHIVGRVDYQVRGMAGVEDAFDETLAAGNEVKLTVDLRLQRALHETLATTMQSTGAKGVWGVTLDAETADILAMVSLPDFDANNYGNASPDKWLNKPTGGVYEMGSVFKLFTMAMALEEKNIPLSEQFDCTKPLSVGKYKIHDSHAKNSWLTMREVFAYSSNIGSAQIGDMLGAKLQQQYFASLGLLDRLPVGLSNAAMPIVPSYVRWKRIQTMSMSYGHGIAVTPAQMVAAARATMVDGVWKQPYLVKNAARMPSHQVFNAKTVASVRELLADVVDYGTASKARVAGYKVGGKTGTSEKSTKGGYLKDKHMASFVGMIPLNNPKLVTLIMVDEGLDGKGGGGVVAAPAFAEFSKKAMALLAIAPTEKTFEMLSDYEQTSVKHAQYSNLEKANYEAITAYFTARR